MVDELSSRLNTNTATPNTTTLSSEAPAMDFVSAGVITHDVERLATFWEQVTGLPATRHVPGPPTEHALISLLALNELRCPRPPPPTSSIWASSEGTGR